MWNHLRDVAICNPFTKEHVFLPNPYAETHHDGLYGFTCCSLGFDPTTKKHKVWKIDVLVDTLQVSNWIFTIGMDKSWREVNIPNFYPQFSKRHNSVCIDGIIYCVDFQHNIAAFRVGDEKLIRSILSPNLNMETGLSFPNYSSKILEIKRQVALVDSSNFCGDENIHLHVLVK